MKILFICKHNKFRSKVAEAIFNKLVSSNKFENSRNAEKNSQRNNIIAESAGTIGSEHKTPDNVVKVLKEKGYIFRNRVARKVDSVRINDYDILIIVANNVEPEFFNNFKGKIIWWKISDCNEKDIDGIRERVDEIEKRVKELVKELK